MSALLNILQAMKDSCLQAHKDGVYAFQHLTSLFYNVLQQLQEAVARALQSDGEESLECTVVNDAAAPVMVLACDISSLAAAPSVVACFSAFASFSRKQCLETDLMKLFASLKRFGQGAGGGDLLPACKQIVAQLTDDGAGALDAVFPEQDVDSHELSAAAEEPGHHDDDGERVGDADDDAGGSCGSPLAATPPPALHGASPLLGGDFGSFAPLLPAFSLTPQQHPALLSPLALQSSFAYDPFRSQDLTDYRSMEIGPVHNDVDSVFDEVVTGLNSSTAKLVKRAQDRHRLRQTGRAGDDELLDEAERDGGEAHALAPAAASRAPSSFVHVNEAETLAANKNIVERLASIESMLTKLTAAGGYSVVGPNAYSGQQNVGDDARHDDARGTSSGAGLLSALSQHGSTAASQGSEHPGHVADTYVLSSRSFDGGDTPLLSARSDLSDATLLQRTASNPQAGRGNTATAAQAAAKYLKNVTSGSAPDSATAVPLPMPIGSSLLPGEKAALLPSDTDSNPQPAAVGPSAQYSNVPANRDSMQNAMRALSGSCFGRVGSCNLKSNWTDIGARNTPDLSGATASVVDALLKANSGNPAYSEAFDPSVIGASLEVILARLHNRSPCMTFCAGF